MKVGTVVAICLSMFVGATTPALTVPPSVTEQLLRDQHGRTSTVAGHRDHVAVVMVITASRLRHLKVWQRDLQERFEAVRYVLIADVPSDPPVTWERVAEKLVRRVPEEVSVWIDLERRWASELELDTSRPNLLLFDRDGKLTARFEGRKNEVLLERVSLALEELVGS